MTTVKRKRKVRTGANIDFAEGDQKIDLTPFQITPEKERRLRPIFISELPIASISDISPIQTREDFNPANDLDDKTLVESVKKEGVITPVWVRKFEKAESVDITYTLIAGHRRIDAAKAAGLETVPALVFPEYFTNEDLARFTFIENHHRKPLTEFELAEQITLIKKGFKMSNAQLANALKISAGKITHLLHLLSADQRLQALVKEGVIKASTAYKISQETPARTLSNVIKAISQGLSITDAIQIGKEARPVVAPGVGSSPKTQTKTNDPDSFINSPLVQALLDQKEIEDLTNILGRKKAFKDLDEAGKICVILISMANGHNWGAGLTHFTEMSTRPANAFKNLVNKLSKMQALFSHSSRMADSKALIYSALNAGVKTLASPESRK